MDEETIPKAADGANESAATDTTPEKSGEGTTAQGANSPNQKTTWFVALSSFFNGAGIGLLLGILLGMAITPVVGKFIGTLAGLLAVLLGLSDKFISTAKAWRLGAFGFFCVGGIFLGMYIRVNNGMLPSNEEMMQEYLKIGYSKEEARDFIAYQKLNLVPTDWKGAEKNTDVVDTIVVTAEGEPEGVNAETGDGAEKASAEKAKTAGKSTAKPKTKPKTGETTTSAPKKREFANTNQTGAQFSSHLYSSEVSVSNCMRLNLLSEKTPLNEIQNSFRKSDGDEPGVWTWMADGIDSKLPEAVQKQVLLNMVNSFCNNDDVDKVVLEDCTLRPEELQNLQLDQVKEKITAQGEVWQSLTNNVLIDISEEYQKPVLINLIKNICHD